MFRNELLRRLGVALTLIAVTDVVFPDHISTLAKKSDDPAGQGTFHVLGQGVKPDHGWEITVAVEEFLSCGVWAAGSAH